METRTQYATSSISKHFNSSVRIKAQALERGRHELKPETFSSGAVGSPKHPLKPATRKSSAKKTEGNFLIERVGDASVPNLGNYFENCSGRCRPRINEKDLSRLLFAKRCDEDDDDISIEPVSVKASPKR